MNGREDTISSWKVVIVTLDPNAANLKREALEFAVAAHRDSDPDEIVKAAKRYEAFLSGADEAA